jgi:hypothetical protein
LRVARVPLRAQVKVYATLDVFGLFANAKFEFLVTVQRQSEAEIAKQVETQYQSTAAGKVKTLEDSIAENEQVCNVRHAAYNAPDPTCNIPLHASRQPRTSRPRMLTASSATRIAATCRSAPPSLSRWATGNYSAYVCICAA